MDDKSKILLLEAAVIIIFLSLAFVPRMYPDEGTYLNYGEAWRTGELIPSAEIPVLHRPVFVSLVSLVSNLSLSLARLILLPFVMGSVYLAYLIGEKLDLRGEITSIPLLLSPIFLFYLGTLLPDFLLVFFILLSIYLFIKSVKENDVKWSYFAGLSTALAVLTKESGALLIPVFLVFYKEFDYKRFLAASLIPIGLYILVIGRDFFLFLGYSLKYSFPIAQPGINTFVNMVSMGLGGVLFLSILGLWKMDYGEFKTKFSLAYCLVFIPITLALSSTWVERYAILFLPGLLIPSAMGLKEIWRKKYLILILLILILGTGAYLYSDLSKAEEEWGTSKYRSGLEAISSYQDEEVFMQINDEQVRWITGSNRFKKLPRNYEQFKEATGCEEVTVAMWKYGEATIWEPYYWNEEISKSIIKETDEVKIFKANCTGQ